MKGLLISTFILLLLGMFSCSKKIKPTNETTELKVEEKVNKYAQNVYQKDYQIDYNASKTVACISKSYKKQTATHPTLSFILYDIASEKIIFKETIARASGEWLDEHQFVVTTIPARIGRAATLDKKEGFIYDTANKTKRKR